MNTNGNLKNPVTIEAGPLLESAKKIANQLTNLEWDKTPYEVRAKSYELAIEKEKARMIYECADSIERIAGEIRQLQIE